MSHDSNDDAPALRAVLFDMDGTLVDTEELWWQAVQHVAAGLEYAPTDGDLPDILGRPVEHTAAHLLKATGTGTPLATLTADLHREFATRVANRIVPRPGAIELLDGLHERGIATALVTASPRAVADTVLAGLGPDRFTVTVTADDTPRTKPDPDPYLAAARALGVPPSACVAVEDTPTGVASAEAAGCRVLAVPSLTPIPEAPGRTVLSSLEQADVALLETIAAGTRFVVPAFTTRNARIGEPFRATVGGLLRGGGGSFTKASGPDWAHVATDGTLTGTPTEAGVCEVVVTTGDGSRVTARVPVVGTDEPLVRVLKVMSWNLWLGGGPVDDHRHKQLKVLLDADVDIVGLQETAGTSTRKLAEALGWHHHQAGHNLGVISRYPIADRFGEPAPSGYGATGVTVRLDGTKDVTVWNAHLNYTPYGPYDACLDRRPVPVLIEHETASGRVAEIQDVLRAMAPGLATRDTTPVLLVGDFNAPSHLDWTEAAAPLHGGYGPVAWPVTKAAEEAGLRDSYRVAHPDPVRAPGATWSPLHPLHEDGSGRAEPQDRIDYVLFAGDGLTVLDSTAHVTGSPGPYPAVAANEWPSDHAAVITTFAVR
ncbi:HAD-IA family hydrolase [Streptomyces hesseae]|uniref:HAD-IA family hydrolase n=1 Tax=Streptomyces hesseae TaxID=3075519 RepID=A0ABU2SKV9_9ACTN|nr:HAD-IA family hydrolase [Streptomyces sp. DSM 40473]MDT0449619.1 HAD-IA family hydrolase [Streptomyces sp. DSM 40473]